MKHDKNKKKSILIFVITFAVVLGCFVAGYIKTQAYNKVLHEDSFEGVELFSQESAEKSNGGVYVDAVARSSTWSKLFDFNDEGLTENNYQA